MRAVEQGKAKKIGRRSLKNCTALSIATLEMLERAWACAGLTRFALLYPHLIERLAASHLADQDWVP